MLEGVSTMKMKWLVLVVMVLGGCTRNSQPSAADRAIIEKEWLTKKGELRRHNVSVLNQGYGDWAHTCSSIEKIELLETTDNGRIYKVIWSGDIFRGYQVAAPWAGGSAGMHTSKMYVKQGHIDSVQVEYSDKTSADTHMESLNSSDVAETEKGRQPVAAQDWTATVVGPKTTRGTFPSLHPRGSGSQK